MNIVVSKEVMLLFSKSILCNIFLCKDFWNIIGEALPSSPLIQSSRLIQGDTTSKTTCSSTLPLKVLTPLILMNPLLHSQLQSIGPHKTMHDFG
uniref:Uncharacterized protein n=1 Tax=Physcomitrium patens TaxID=3218 RepID=A0A2K1IBI0_PHYPA|nr:hypothetical protein PHYPA_030107 [Physcomitrium patens]